MSSYHWFYDWTNQNLALTLTAARGANAADILAAFGLESFAREPCTLAQGDESPVPIVRIGEADDVAFAVEHFTSIGGLPVTLERLSSVAGRSAVSIVFNQTISVLKQAQDGEFVNGLDVDVRTRYGTRPHDFDRALLDSGVLSDDVRTRRAGCALYLERAVGLVITPELLEGPLPCATLQGRH